MGTHYCEQMLLEEGYEQRADLAKATHAELVLAAKYRLAQSREALLRLCRFCCSNLMKPTRFLRFLCPLPNDLY